MRSRDKLLVLLMVVGIAACSPSAAMDAKFGDQHFKTAVSLIELHRVRTGEYPASLGDLQYLGDWDQIALSSVAYTRLREGYRLDVTRGWVARPDLRLPAEYFRGLGLRESNVVRGRPGEPMGTAAQRLQD
jgi:hypothetical protein